MLEGVDLTRQGVGDLARRCEWWTGQYFKMPKKRKLLSFKESAKICYFGQNFREALGIIVSFFFPFEDPGSLFFHQPRICSYVCIPSSPTTSIWEYLLGPVWARISPWSCAQRVFFFILSNPLSCIWRDTERKSVFFFWSRPLYTRTGKKKIHLMYHQ